MATKRGLGKGLDALFADNESELLQETNEESGEGSVTTVRISELDRNEHQPRQEFDEEKLEELCASIKEHGVLTPLIVVRRGESGHERYMIVAGERRWRAARRAGLREVPVVIRDLDERGIREISLIENLQREDLNAIEEALGFRALMDEFELTQEEIAKRMSQSRAAVANTLRLLSLPPEIIEMVRSGDISAGHARALLSYQDKDLAIRVARQIATEGISVRETEKLAREKKERVIEPDMNQLYYTELENAVGDRMGRRVRIVPGKNKGKVELEYYNVNDLEALLAFLSGEEPV